MPALNALYGESWWEKQVHQAPATVWSLQTDAGAGARATL